MKLVRTGRLANIGLGPPRTPGKRLTVETALIGVALDPIEPQIPEQYAHFEVSLDESKDFILNKRVEIVVNILPDEEIPF